MQKRVWDTLPFIVSGLPILICEDSISSHKSTDMAGRRKDTAKTWRKDSERMKVAESRTKRQRKSHERAATGGATVTTKTTGWVWR